MGSGRFPLQTAATCFGVMGMALAVVIAPAAVSVAGAIAWATLALWHLPGRVAVAVPLFILLALPFDFIAGFDDAALGLPVLGASVLLAAYAVFRNGTNATTWADWDLVTLLGVIGFAGLLHFSSGQLRLLVFWLAAALILIWLRCVAGQAVNVGSQIRVAIIGAGALTGAVAFLEFMFGVDAGIIPGYRPAMLSFSESLGGRAAGLSGHPLRCGTLSMLSAILSLGYLVRGIASPALRAALICTFSLSLVGLGLSGARGSWLAFGTALSTAAVVLVFRDRRRVVRLGAIVAGIVVIVWVSGFWTLIYERLFGIASHPDSFGQRLGALRGLLEVWRDTVLVGVGLGGASEITMRMGLSIPNLENEYLRFFLACGIAGPLALLLVGWRRVRVMALEARDPVRAGVMVALCALFINIATYNLFSWSSGPILLFALASAGGVGPEGSNRGSP